MVKELTFFFENQKKFSDNFHFPSHSTNLALSRLKSPFYGTCWLFSSFDGFGGKMTAINDVLATHFLQALPATAMAWTLLRCLLQSLPYDPRGQRSWPRVKASHRIKGVISHFGKHDPIKLGNLDENTMIKLDQKNMIDQILPANKMRLWELQFSRLTKIAEICGPVKT